MTRITSSNGVDVRTSADGRIETHGAKSSGWSTVEPRLAQALREFFRAEADERLGRWRWPENPDFVVYPQEGGGAWVLAENDPGSIRYSGRFLPLGLHAPSTESLYALAARAYFDAHPEPKPWHDAAPGEVWDVDLPSGGMRAVTVYSARHEEPITVFRDAHTQTEIETDDPDIRDARRIFPEVQP